MISGPMLVSALIQIIIAGIIFSLLLWAIAAVGIAEPFARVAKGLLILVAVVFLINVLMSFSGHPLIAWR